MTTTLQSQLASRVRKVGVRKVSELSGLSEPMVSRLAAGKSRMFLDQAVALAKACGTKLALASGASKR